jgi:hypothetical protein
MYRSLGPGNFHLLYLQRFQRIKLPIGILIKQHQVIIESRGWPFNFGISLKSFIALIEKQPPLVQIAAFILSLTVGFIHYPLSIKSPGFSIRQMVGRILW